MATDRLDRATTLARPDAHDDLVRQLDGQVRERVRREGVDPQRDAGLVRRIAEGVVRDHDERGRLTP
jgi:pilus assembly protein CpaF